MPVYKLFVPPEKFLEKEAKDWTKKEANEYLQWFCSVKNERTNNFRQFMEISNSPTSEQEWNEISQRFYDIVTTENFSNTKEYPDPFTNAKKTHRELTNQGFAFSADMGLFMFDVIENQPGKKLEYQPGKGPTRFASRNMPIVLDKTGYQLDPVEIGITTTQTIINGNTHINEWYEKYAHFEKSL